jgi:hypothetical protein
MRQWGRKHLSGHEFRVTWIPADALLIWGVEINSKQVNIVDDSPLFHHISFVAALREMSRAS